MTHAQRTVPESRPPVVEYSLISAPGWPHAHALDATDDDLAVELGRRIARSRDDAHQGRDWPTSHRVERCDGPARRVLQAWVSRR